MSFVVFWEMSCQGITQSRPWPSMKIGPGIVSLPVEVVEDVPAAVEGDLPLRGHAPQNHAIHANLLHISPCSYRSQMKVTPLVGKIHASLPRLSVTDFPSSRVISG